MNYYIKTYSTFFKKSLIAKMEYRKDLFIGILGFFLENLASVLSIYFIIRNIPSLQGWTMYELGLLYGFTRLPIGVDHFFTDELWRVAYFRVKQGDVDRYFLRPAPVLFQIIADKVQLEALGELILGIIMFCVCAANCKINWSFQFVLLLFIAVIFGALIITSIKIFTTAFAFVIKRSGMITQVFYNFKDYAKYPVTIYPSFIRAIMLFIAPFGLITSMPIQAILFGTYNIPLLMVKIILMTALFLIISIATWNICIKHYESSGS